MADFFRFIRQSSKLIFGSRQKKSKKIVEPKTNINVSNSERNMNQQPTRVDNLLLRYLNNPCIHVSDSKWEDIWRNTIEPKSNYLLSIVFVNPNFSRTYYVPLCFFVCDCEDYAEYNSGINNEILSLMKKNQYDQWMSSTIRSDSCYVSLHVCQVIELLDRLCVRIPHLARLNLHYYFLDNEFVDYIVRYLPNLVSINIENSIGLNEESYQKLGALANLTYLNVAGCDLYERALLNILESIPTLESLNISNNCAITGHCLTSSGVKKLKRLNIRDCWRISTAQFIDMFLVGLPNLLELLCNTGVCDESVETIAKSCPNLIHLDISFEEFTYNDQAGFNILTEKGFIFISKMINLKVLRLRHIGRLTDNALAKIISNCCHLVQITLNLRHRHKLTDNNALTNIGIYCPNLVYFEAVHNHFISRNCIVELSCLESSLQVLILRGSELVKDDDMALLIQKCCNLRILSLDGCIDIGMNTLTLCIIHARKIKKDSNGVRPQFRASLILTSVERSIINSLLTEFPPNFRVRACDYDKNKLHYNEFDGKTVQVHQLRETFFPFYWHDFN